MTTPQPTFTPKPKQLRLCGICRLNYLPGNYGIVMWCDSCIDELTDGIENMDHFIARKKAQAYMYAGLINGPFPYAFTISVDYIPIIVGMLCKSRPGAPNGSSFAITSDAQQGKRTVWLSEISYQTIKRKGFDIFREPVKPVTP